MTTNPAVKILSYLTYFSILFHVVDGIALTISNRKARPSKYKYSKPGTNSKWASRNMMILGTLVLVFIVMHMGNFWFEYKWGEWSKDGGQEIAALYMTDEYGDYVLKNTGESVPDGKINEEGLITVNGEEGKRTLGPAMKDLHGLVYYSFSHLWYVILYVVSMIFIGLHLSHGFQSGFQTLGLNHPKYTPIIKKAGTAFAIIVPAAFAIIPIVIYLTEKVM